MLRAGTLLRALPWVLYGLAFANCFWTLQLPHGVLLHWLAGAAFTLSLQLALQVSPVPPCPTHAVPPAGAAGELFLSYCRMFKFHFGNIDHFVCYYNFGQYNHTVKISLT